MTQMPLAPQSRFWSPRMILALIFLGGIVLPGIIILSWYEIVNHDAILSLTPVFSLWILIPLVTAALVLTAFLYREQRRMASLRWVVWLTLLRLGLLGLLAVLFLQPQLRWTSKRVTAGTLWVIVDQSPSMQAIDTQATDAERLHWAEGMGLAQRSLRPDELAAQTKVLAAELDALQPDPAAGYSGDEQAVIKAAAEKLDAWIAELKKFESTVADAKGTLNNFSWHAGDDAVDQLDAALSQAKQNVSAMRSADTVMDAASALQPADIGNYLNRAREALLPAAAAADAQFLHNNAGTTSWTSANQRISADTRQNLMDGLLTGDGALAAKPMLELSRQYTLRVGSFADKTQSSGTVDETSLIDTLRASMNPAGQATNIAGTLQYVAAHVPADEAASVIIVTDGRSNIGGEPTVAASILKSRGVHVYGIMIGSRELSPDAAVEPVDFPDWIFKGDTVKPRALIRLDGLQGQVADVQAYRGGVLLQEQHIRVTLPHQMAPFEFSDQPPDTEKVLEYEIKVLPMQGESNTQNNTASFRVAVKKDKLYALIIEDRPRWEYRYLAAYLSRRPGMLKLQTVLLQPAVIAGIAPPAAVMASPDNKQTEATQLPTTLADWEKFDVIVIGDVGPETITPQMQQYIATTVRDKGSTLITIAGQHAMPASYVGSTLADLLPVTTNPQYGPADIARDTKNGFHPQSGPTAGMSVLAQLGPDADSSGKAWLGMPVWYWHSPYTETKPAATAVWTIGLPDAGGDAGNGGGGGADDANDPGLIAQANRHALLATFAYGSGRSLYLASDQSWRLRQVGGLNLHDRFWGQVLNWAVGSELPAGGKYVRFGADQPTYDQTQPVIVTARVLKDDLTPYTGLDFSAVARPLHGASSAPSTGGGAGNSVEARFVPMNSPGYYKATLTGLPIGDDEITLQGPEVERLLNTDPTVTLRNLVIKVFPTMNAERQNMNTDADKLEQIALAGGGYSVDGPYASLLLSHLPKIEHTETAIRQLGFFTDPHETGTHIAHWVFLALFVILITLEWGLRKRAGLV